MVPAKSLRGSAPARGPKTVPNDGERRKLENELLNLSHERVPEIGRKVKARDGRKEREKRERARDRIGWEDWEVRW